MTYTIRTPRSKIDFRDYPDEVKADKWRNLYFSKDGRTHYGIYEHTSEDAAIKSSASWLLEFGHSHLPVVNAPQFRCCDITHAIPMPVKS